MGNEQHPRIGVEPGTGGTPTPQLHVGQMRRSRLQVPHGPLLEGPGLLEHERQVGQGTSQVERQVHPVGLDGVDHQRHPASGGRLGEREVDHRRHERARDATCFDGVGQASRVGHHRLGKLIRQHVVEARHLPDVEHRGNASPAARSPHPPPGESHEAVADHHVGPKCLDDRGHRVLGHGGGEVLVSSDGALPRLAAGLSFEPPKHGAERVRRGTEPPRRRDDRTPTGSTAARAAVVREQRDVVAAPLQHAGQLSLAPP